MTVVNPVQASSCECRVQYGEGVAGLVAQTGVPVNIRDAYQVGIFYRNISLTCLVQDDRFNDSMDQVTGYTTHSIACLPFFNHQVEVSCLYSPVWSLSFQGEVAGVAQIVNKKSGPEFTQADIEVKILDCINLSALCLLYRYLRNISHFVGWEYRMLNFLRLQSWSTRRTSCCLVWQNPSSKNSRLWTA